MTAPRRVLLSIGLLLLSLVGAIFIVGRLQTRALGEALVTDVQATLARTIERDPPLTSPRHHNGYACLGEVLDVTPKDLGPFGTKNNKLFLEVMDGGVVPEDWEAKAASLAPWAEAMRECGDSAQLKFVPGVTPFSTATEGRSVRGDEAVLALGRLTRFEARLLGAEGKWDAVAERCAGTMEVALDRSHLNLIGAMVAGGAVRGLVAPCGDALERMSPEVRPTVAERFSRLPARLAANHELMEAERQVVSVEGYSWLMSSEQRAKVPPISSWMSEVLENGIVRFALARIWPRWDRAMRRLIAASDVRGAERQAASEALGPVFSPWWLPNRLQDNPDYEHSLRRNEDARVLLQLLADLAAGGTKPLPAQVTRTSAGLEFTDFNGEKLIIPGP